MSWLFLLVVLLVLSLPSGGSKKCGSVGCEKAPSYGVDGTKVVLGPKPSKLREPCERCWRDFRLRNVAIRPVNT